MCAMSRKDQHSDVVVGEELDRAFAVSAGMTIEEEEESSFCLDRWRKSVAILPELLDKVDSPEIESCSVHPARLGGSDDNMVLYKWVVVGRLPGLHNEKGSKRLPEC